MGALSIAFDTIIVGALALPWLVFATDLFFLDGQQDDRRALRMLAYVKNDAKVQPVAAVLLFAVAYLAGSAISRTAQDFFNDDDLIPTTHITEDNIRAAEYCAQEREILTELKVDPSGENFRIVPGEFDTLCAPLHDSLDGPGTETRSGRSGTEGPKQRICPRLFGNFCAQQRDEVVSRIGKLFQLEEGALLLNGEDKTERLRQLHDQISVLRGAAFDGILAATLCLFGWCATKQVRIRRILAFVPGLFFFLGVISLFHHFQTKDINDAPFMELTVILLGFTGFFSLWRGEQRRWYGFGLFTLLLLLTFVAYLGWWRTEVLYDRQIIYSFYAQTHPSLQ